MNLQPYTRLAVAAAGLALSATAAWLNLHETNPVGEAATAIDTGDTAKAVGLFRQAVMRDNGNPYRWADLAESLAASGDIATARQCIDRAVKLGGAIPAIWVRHANFCFLHNEPGEALRSSSRVLQTVPDYDAVLFHYFDQVVDDPKRVLDSIGPQRRATRSWLSYLIGVNKPEAAQLTWRHVLSSGYADPPLTASYVEFLLRHRSFEPAQSAWASALGKLRGDYPSRNLLFNGGFQSDPLPGPLDWTFRTEPDLFETTRDAGSVRIQFHGKANVNYDHLSQTAILPHAGSYRLSMRIKTGNITTNEGLRLAITDLGLATDPITGTNDWTTINLDFSVPQPRTVRVALVRRPSQKFDNKIDGTAEIDYISLIPQANGGIASR